MVFILMEGYQDQIGKHSVKNISAMCVVVEILKQKRKKGQTKFLQNYHSTNAPSMSYCHFFNIMSWKI